MIGLISFFNQIDWDDLKHCVMYYLVFKDLIKDTVLINQLSRRMSGVNNTYITRTYPID